MHTESAAYSLWRRVHQTFLIAATALSNLRANKKLRPRWPTKSQISYIFFSTAFDYQAFDICYFLIVNVIFVLNFIDEEEV